MALLGVRAYSKGRWILLLVLVAEEPSVGVIIWGSRGVWSYICHGSAFVDRRSVTF